jgi:hypothetical protein
VTDRGKSIAKRELNEYEMEAVEERLADYFYGKWEEVAEDIGIDATRPLSDEEDRRLQAEFDRRYKQRFIDEWLEDHPTEDD